MPSANSTMEAVAMKHNQRRERTAKDAGLELTPRPRPRTSARVRLCLPKTIIRDDALVVVW
jgi:hypothetical protein